MIKCLPLFLLFLIFANFDNAYAQVSPPTADVSIQQQDFDTLEDQKKIEERNQLEASYNSPIISNGSPGLEPLDKRIRIVRPDLDLNQIPSLFFTPSEESLIEEARLGLTTRPPGLGGLNEGVRGPRELALGGIVYLSQGDWTIWLNGQKITPKRLPPEILDISVRKEYIKLKWYDAFTNQIFPIKLRTHQRFNIDTRIFLPGEAATPPDMANNF